MDAPSPLDRFFEARGIAVLDGGLATELQNRGHDLDHPLWSARLLSTHPQVIRETHLDYLRAGADCVTSASYQASIPGLAAEGLMHAEAEGLLRSSVRIACEARERYVEEQTESVGHVRRPAVAASVGPYGAYLADGSEYRGCYGISRRALRAFHEPRLSVLVDAGADLLACETIPSRDEAEVLRELLDPLAELPTWISFACRNSEQIADGNAIEPCVALFEDCAAVFAIGVNCTAPQYVSSLIVRARSAAPSKRTVVYPNSGEVYDAQRRTWAGSSDPSDFGRLAREWFERGATLIGGCCRTGPRHIEAICDAFPMDHGA